MLMEPILDKFRGIPKLVIAQFCRGDYMNSVATTDGDTQRSSNVNGQESVYSKVFTV